MFAAFDVPLGWGELLKRTAKETSEDDCLGLAAQLAYYFFLALFPDVLLCSCSGELLSDIRTRAVLDRCTSVDWLRAEAVSSSGTSVLESRHVCTAAIVVREMLD